jgi:nucleotide-binding universal stress UspA family protein
MTVPLQAKSNPRSSPEQSTVSNPLSEQIFYLTKIENDMNALLAETQAPRTIRSDADLSIKKILVAVDLSPRSEETTAYAAELAAPFGASLTLVHVCSPKEAGEETGKKANRFDDPMMAAEEALGDLARKARGTCPSCSAYLCVGDPAEKIIEMAETLHADLILTGSHNQSSLGQLLGLNQPSRIVHRAPCPVLVYHDSN